MKGYCDICEKEIEIHTCCDGYQCGCMGQPTEPPICSSEVCYFMYMNKLNKQHKPNLPFGDILN